MLLHVASHVAIQDHPKIEGAVDPLDFFQHVGVGNLNFDPEVLLFIDEDGFGETKRCGGRRLAVSGKFAASE